MYNVIPKLNLSKQDFTKIALGAAMSCVHLAVSPKRTTELLLAMRNWTNGEISDERVKEIYKELYKLSEKAYDGGSSESQLDSANMALDIATIATYNFQDNDLSKKVVEVIDAAYAHAKKENIIASIEKEIGMPIEDFLFKNEEQD